MRQYLWEQYLLRNVPGFSPRRIRTSSGSSRVPKLSVIRFAHTTTNTTTMTPKAHRRTGAVLLMTAIRAAVRKRREVGSDIKNLKQVEGYELDWLAKETHSSVSWEVASSVAGDGGGQRRQQ